MAPLDLFSPPTRAWFESTFEAPTVAQTDGWASIAAGQHTLIHAPTGSGKTLAAFLYGLDALYQEETPPDNERCRVLYVSPMKALAYDVDRNLRAPLTGIQLAAERLGLAPPRISTAMRTGDTPQTERRQMHRHPPDVLITTPESLYLMLTSAVSEILKTVRWVIVDEIHAVAGTKRGTHLSVTLERLQENATGPVQRIGLSATQRPLEDIAGFLAGGDIVKDVWTPRPVHIVDAPRHKELDIEIVVPVEDMTRPDETAIPYGEADKPPVRSIWPAMYPRLLDLIKEHRSTIVFVNSRGLAERLSAELNNLAGEDLTRAHHGSVSREHRVEIESGLKTGELRGVVATSSLELGIDMAAVDLVLLVESPSSVASGLQRVGRAGHQVGAASRARVFPKHRGDLLEAAVVVEQMYAGGIEATKIPRNPLDVLAQQVVAMVAVKTWEVEDLYALIRQAFPYQALTRPSFESVLDMLSGRYPSDEFAELRPRIVWDRVAGTLSARNNARMLAVTNPGTIPDRGLYTVVLPEGGKVGELDEEMVYESRPGDVFVLGSTAWRISEIDHDRVIVTPAPGEPSAKMPFWHGDGPGRPLELGRAVGKFVREVGGMKPEEALATLKDRYRLDEWAAQNLARMFEDERAITGTVPSDKTIVIEQFRDEIGDWRTVILSPFGSRIHAPWALAIRKRYRDALGHDTDVLWSDDGIVVRFADIDEPAPIETLLIDPDEIEELVIEEVADSALFTSRFRESAARALLLPRRRPGNRTPLWLQRRRSADLLQVAKGYGSFPIVLETYREVLQDHFDLPALIEVLGDIRSRKIRVHDVALTSPSPFASSLMFDFIANFMYAYDAPIAEKRAAALTLDRSLLRELLGDIELRDLLDPEVIAHIELELQRLTPERKTTSLDGIHDLLRDLGPLSTDAVVARSEGSSMDWLDALEATRRITRVRMAGEERWAAVEDVARLRDALGVSPPPGIADSLLESVADPMGDVVGRFARTHAPFTASDAADSLGLPAAAVTEVLQRLEQSGRVTAGTFSGDGREWVDTEVLRRIKRRSLAALRSEIEPVEAHDVGRFLPSWHGVGKGSSHRSRLLDVIGQLQGAAIPASILESDVLAARMEYSPALLDELAASGELVWIGRSPLGAKDGKVALYRRDQVSALHWPIEDSQPAGELHEKIRAHLVERGAVFFRDLYDAVGGGDQTEVLAALWDLVWAGEVTNDTLAPLRAFLLGKAKRSGRPNLSSAAPPSASGRWYLTADLLRFVLPEHAAMARSEQLLDRFGVVTRDAVLSEGIPGGFAGLYPVLATLEDAGRVRRGYFVEGLGGAQFASPGAVDRVRAKTDTGIVTLAAADPANPYGSVVPWPEHSGRPSRSAGAHVVLVDGRLAAFVERGGRTILTFIEDGDTVAAALASLANRRFRRMKIETVDGEPVANSHLATGLVANGFKQSYKGFAFSDRPTTRSR